MSGGARIAAGSKDGWRLSIGRMMFGVLIVAVFLTEESRIILVVLAYVLYPIAILWLAMSKRLKRVAGDRPATWRLAWIAVAGVMAGWPVLFLIPSISDDNPSMRLVIGLARAFVFAPVVLASLVTWLLIPLPPMERIRP